MAIQQNKIVKGVPINGCYIKVLSVSGDKRFLHANIGFCANAQEQPLDLQTIIFEPSMEGGNFIKQTYEHLKTLPEFANAQDC